MHQFVDPNVYYLLRQTLKMFTLRYAPTSQFLWIKQARNVAKRFGVYDA